MNTFKEKLVSLDRYYQSLQAYLNKLKQIKKIIIWGASSSGQTVYEFLKAVDLNDKVLGFADNDFHKWGGEFINQKKILSPNEVLKIAETEENLYIINAVQLMAIKEQLVLQGINEHKIDMGCYQIANNYITKQPEMIYEHINDYEKVYSLLEDERSKEIYLAKLNYKLTGDHQYLKGLTDNSEQYFDNQLIHLIENEVFVDCGSFEGDTLNIFYELSKGKYKKYIALEADAEVYNELEKHVKEKNYPNVRLLKKACWHEQALLNFQAKGSIGSCITEDGNVKVEADSLDNLLKGQSITFIKMDIEGAEENALKGAEKIIKRDKPILAICIYHKTTDYFKLPLLIKSLNEEYQLYIRHYSKVDMETVCYAIPKNRLSKDKGKL